MKIKNVLGLAAIAAFIGAGAQGMAGQTYSITAADTDGDNINDDQDNCIQSINPDQRDTDGDGLGNACDADFNNDCIVNVSDLGVIKANFFSANPDADLDGSGVVNSLDLGIFKSLFFLPPGPSGLTNLCELQLEPGFWLELPGTDFDQVEKQPEEYEDFNPVTGFSQQYWSVQGDNAIGFNAILANWSGGTYVPWRKSVIFFGGGNYAYRGNEILEARLQTRSVHRLTDPTIFPVDSVPEQADGRPTSRHTYNSFAADVQRRLVYICDGGIPGVGRGSEGTRARDLWAFDPDAADAGEEPWTRLADPPFAQVDSNLIYIERDADGNLVDKVFRFQPTSPQGVWMYDPATDVWTNRLLTGPGSDYNTRTHRIGSNEIWLYGSNVNRLKIYNFVTNEWNFVTTTGDAPPSGFFPGFVWSEALDRAVYWSGGSTLYTLDTNYVWHRHDADPANNVIPSSPFNGTADPPFGKFQYIPYLDAYFAVLQTTENIFIGRIATQ